jgi:hypothetical protein
VTGGSNFAGESLKPQLAGNGKGTAVIENGKVQRDKSEPGEIEIERGGFFIVGKKNAQPAVMLEERFPITSETRPWNGGIAARREGFVGSNERPIVLNKAVNLKQGHRAPP